MESDSSNICHIDSPDMPDMQSVDEVDQFKEGHYTNSTSNSQMTKVNSDYPDIIQPPTTYTLQPISVDFADHNAAIINSTPKSNSELIPSVFPSNVETSHTMICSLPVTTSLTTSSQKNTHDSTEHSSADETMLCCPCCNENLTASHQCEIPNISDVSSDSILHKPDDNQICTPTPDHNHTPSAPPPHSPAPDPPDGNTSNTTNDPYINNIVLALSVLIDDAFSKPK